AEDGDLGLEVGRLDVGDQAPFESRAKSLLECGDVLRLRVRREHDLLLVLVQRVEGVEELLLRPFLAGEKLDVVEQEGVDGAVTLAERRHLVVADRGDQVGDEAVGRHVDDLLPGVFLADPLADGLDQVRLAEARSTIDEERIERAAGVFGDGERRGVRELVRAADDEGREAVAWIEYGGGKLVAGRLDGERRKVVGGVFDHEVNLDPFGRELVQQFANVRAKAIAYGVDVLLRRDADIDRVAAACEKPGRGEPHFIVRPVNGLLDPGKELIPDIHGGKDRSYLLENPQVFHSCGKSGPFDGPASLACTKGSGHTGIRPSSGQFARMLFALCLTSLWAVTILSAFFHAVFSRGYCNEAYFSAKQPSPQAHARLPRPDAGEGRTGGAFAPSPQGPQAPGGLVSHRG